MCNIRVNLLSKTTQIHNTLGIGKLRIFIVLFVVVFNITDFIRLSLQEEYNKNC